MSTTTDIDFKCLVKTCHNNSTGGVFIGRICAPCHEVLFGTRVCRFDTPAVIRVRESWQEAKGGIPE